MVAIRTSDVVAVAEFRAGLRQFLRRSERIAREAGLTPQRYLLLLMIKGAVDGVDRVGARPAPEPVGAAAARDDVVARSAEDPVGSGPATERVVSAEAEDHVVEPSTREILAASRSDDAAAPAVRRCCSNRLGGLRADDELAVGVRRSDREAQRVADVCARRPVHD